MKTLKILFNGFVTFAVILPFVCLIYRPFCWAKWYLKKGLKA